MQDIDVARVVMKQRLIQRYPTGTVLGHVDMRDLAEVAAKVVTEPGHSHATYDISSGERLSVDEICAVIARIAGKAIASASVEPGVLIEIFRRHWPTQLSDYSVKGFHRLFGYDGRHGIHGNPSVLTWLLGRPPETFEAYVRRSLAGVLVQRRSFGAIGNGPSNR